MDWQATNNNMETTWSNRTTPESSHQTHSVAVEHMVELANTVGANPWFCIPHMVDDDYVRRFATVVHASLRPDVKVGSWNVDIHYLSYPITHELYFYSCRYT